jgi:uncharacterized membrane protein YesL
MRLLLALLAALSTAFQNFWRVLRQLFHEVTGAFFVFFAIFGVVSAWRHWRRNAEGWLIALSVAFALMMAAFAVVSFRSARRVR